MCGISGIAGLKAITHFAKEPDPIRIVERMNDALAHRGPDAHGIWKGSDVVLGHRRLSILDLSTAANQPMTTPDGRYTIIFNGETYNYRRVRAELDVPWRTNGDTEVVLHAWAKWGADCLPKLEGMFAFALWDEQGKELFLVRDRLGIKPLYYANYVVHGDGRDEFGVCFGSEVRALLRSGVVAPKLNKDALPDYLRYGTVNGMDTLIQNVQMLRPGSVHRFKNAEPTYERGWLWWNPVSHARTEAAHLPINTVQKEVKERLSRAVEKRLISDVPFGAFLSGGIDSSAVVGLMAQASNTPVHTFSVGFNEEKFSEERYARIIAKKFNTEHTVIRLQPDDMLRMLPGALASMDHPSADGPNTWVVSKVTKEAGITMALSGLGGDEVFAGYDVFKRSMALQRKRWIMAFPKPLRALAGAMIKNAKKGAAGAKAAELLKLSSWDLVDTYPLSRLAFTPDEMERLLAGGDQGVNYVRIIVAGILLESEGGYRLPLLSQVSLCEISTYIQSVLLRDADQMSMAHALEVRVPFLDHELIEFVLGVSDEHKYPYTPKKLLVDSLGDLLPKEIVNRPKMGFTLPWEHWMKHELRSFCEARLVSLGKHPEFKPEGLQSLWQRFLNGDPRITWSRVWMLVVLADWLEQNGIE